MSLDNTRQLALPPVKIREFDATQLAALSPLSLTQGEIHLWWAYIPRLETGGEEWEKLLSRQERQKMKRFHFPLDRVRFSITRGIVRLLAGRYLNLAPGRINFRHGPYGKPELQGPGGAFFSFNISHAHYVVVFACATLRRLGVDVEHIRPLPDLPEIVNYCFHPREKTALNCLSPVNRQQAFFECWTRKEAFVKATGEGLSRSLTSFFISPDSDSNDSPLRVTGAGINSTDWALRTFTPFPGYAGALVCERQVHPLA